MPNLTANNAAPASQIQPPANDSQSPLTVAQVRTALDAWASRAAAGELRAAAVANIWECISRKESHLYISGFGLTEMPPYLPRNLLNLDVSHNRLSTFPAGLPDTLTILDLCDNLIVSIGHAAAALTNLTIVDISYNCLEEVVMGFPVAAKVYAEGMRPLDTENVLDAPCSGYFDRLFYTGVVMDWTAEQTAALEEWAYLAAAGEDRLTAFDCIIDSIHGRHGSRTGGPFDSLDLAWLNLYEAPPHLPPWVITLNLSHNRLTQFPASLPAGLAVLDLCDNMIVEQPVSVPLGMRILDMSHNCLRDPSHVPPAHYEFLTDGNRMPGAVILPDVICRGYLDRLIGEEPTEGQTGSRMVANVAARNLEEALSADSDSDDDPEIDEPDFVNGTQNVSAWYPMAGRADIVARWAPFVQETGSRDFFMFMYRLGNTSNAAVPVFREHVFHWLSQLQASDALRSETFRFATDAIGRCDDRITLSYNKMQEFVLVDRIRGGHFDARVPDLIVEARNAFRLERLEVIAKRTVDALARANRHGVDQIEVFMAYQVKLSEPLALNIPVKSMLFYASSQVTEGDIAEAGLQVKREENAGFLPWLIQWHAWDALVKRKCPDAHLVAEETRHDTTEALRGTLERRVTAQILKDELPDDEDTRNGIRKRMMDAISDGAKMALTVYFLQMENCRDKVGVFWD